MKRLGDSLQELSLCIPYEINSQLIPIVTNYNLSVVKSITVNIRIEIGAWECKYGMID